MSASYGQHGQHGHSGQGDGNGAPEGLIPKHGGYRKLKSFLPRRGPLKKTAASLNDCIKDGYRHGGRNKRHI